MAMKPTTTTAKKAAPAAKKSAVKTVAAAKPAPAAKAAPAQPKAAAPKAAAPKAAAPKAVKKTAAAKSVKVVAAGASITQAALMQLVAEQTGMTKAEAKRFVDAYLDIVKAHVMKGVKVKIGDLGTIMIRARKARMGRNPRTGEPVKIKASKKLAFRQSATMREAVK